MLCRLLLLYSLIGLTAASAQAEEANWFAVTVDNDIFLGNDNWYTNGIYASWVNTANQNDLHQPGLMTIPINWSLDIEGAQLTLQAYTLGQIMVTPEDIRIINPPLTDMPYSGTLLFHSTFIAVQESHADAAGTAIGIVGPASGAERSQKRVHVIVGADEPKGWDSQLGDEIIFQVNRARLWRAWYSKDDRSDFLVLADIGAGTLSSYLASAMLVRFGRGLFNTFETPLLINTRSANPAAVNGAWYAFAGARFEYVFNNIFGDGNTFKDSRSIDFDHSQIGLTAGLALSWKQLSITLALYESNITDSSAGDFTRFGTLTLGWQY